MKKLVAVLTGALSVLLTSGVAQARTTFPHVNDNYDISDPAAWGGTIPTEEVTFLETSAVYTNSRDVTFKSVLQTQSNPQDIVFRMSPSYLVTVTGSFGPYYANTKQTFDGGRWSIGGILSASGTNSKGCSLALTNGVVVNAGGFTVGNSAKGSNARVVVTDNSELNFVRGDSFGNWQVGASVVVSDGGKLTWNDGYFKPWGDSSTNNVFLVTGAGSTANYCGDRTSPARIAETNSVGNLLRIEKGATCWFSGGNFGNNVGAVSNRIEVSDAGTVVESRGNLTVNGVEGSLANDLWVVDGAEFKVVNREGNYCALTVGGSGRSAVTVSNATLRCRKFTIGDGVASEGNVLRVVGKSSVLDTPMAAGQRLNIFGKGGHNLFVLDGADWSSPIDTVGTSHTGNESCSNTVAFLNGSTVSLLSFTLGYNAGTGDDNLLIVAGGSTLQLNDTSETKDVNVLTVGGARNTIVVSNATISAGNEHACLSVGYAITGSSTVGTGNGIVLQGASPRVSAANGTIRAQNASRLVFEIPAEGYANVPLTASTIRLADDTVIDIACEDFQKTLRSRATVVLARATTSLNVSQAVLDAANEKLLPLKRELKIDGMDLVLKVRPANVGLILILR